MQLQIESPHIEPGKKLTDLIRSKFEHLSKRYDRINHCDVVLRKQKSDKQDFFLVEAKLEVPRSILFASDKAESFEIALEKVINELEHQLNRHKDEIEEVR
jgi:putative sigma-54 modulation protein